MFKTTLKIEGMMCGMCESHINDAIRRAFSVKKVISSFHQGKTEIISEFTLDQTRLKEVIAQTGYTLLDIRSEPYQKKRVSFLGKQGKSHGDD